jgi:methyl-accepting chemotaxis protein
MLGMNLQTAALTFESGKSPMFLDRAYELRKQIEDTLSNIESSNLFEKEAQILKKIKESHSNYIYVQDRISNSIRGEKIASARADIGSMFPDYYKAYLTSIMEFQNEQQNSLKNATSESLAYMKSIKLTSMVSFLMLVLFSILLPVYIFKTVFNPLGGDPEEVKNILKNVSEGDLTIQSTKTHKGSLMSYTMHMITNLNKIILKIKNVSSSLSNLSEELNSHAVETKKRLQVEQDKAKIMADAINIITMNISDVSANAEKIANNAKTTSISARKGREIALSVTDETEKIAKNVNEATGLISKLTEKSNQIGAVINVLKDITDQTNLLALNAAIEAARAGEAGRGFAVVAGEVRNLAERAQLSTKEIEKLILTIQSEIQNVFDKIMSGKDSVINGVSYSRDAMDTFNNISENVVSLQKDLEDITSSILMMVKSSDDVNKEVQNLSLLISESNEEAESIVKSSIKLEELSSVLGEAVEIFNTNNKDEQTEKKSIQTKNIGASIDIIPAT